MEWRPADDAAPDDYAGPPPTQPGYPQPEPYAQPAPYAPNPYAQPNPYGYPQPGPYGYPAGYGYAPSYAPLPPGERRPGTLIAASVLGYVSAGLLILSGLSLLFGASLVDTATQALGGQNQYSSELALDGVVNFVAAGLLIGGGVAMITRNATGRILYGIANGIVVVEAIYWLARWESRYNVGGFIVWAVMFMALAVVGVALAFTGECSRWLARR